MLKKICVIGSINMDLVVDCDSFVKPGETVYGKGFFTAFGGKGANQAVACARLGGDVSFVGMLGGDIYGDECLKNLANNNINTQHIKVCGNTGIAVIEVEQCGENRIVIVPGSNGLVDKTFIDQNIEFILSHDIFLLQNEIPLDTNYYLIEILGKNNKTIIFDPAPAVGIELSKLVGVKYLTPNNSELQTLSGESQIERGMKKLEKSQITTILKAGKDGAYICNDTMQHFPAAKYGEVVDTTGAGDTFNGALAYALANDYSLENAIKLSNKAAGYSVTQKGAQVEMSLNKLK